MSTGDLITAVVSVPWRNAMAGEVILIVEDNKKNLKLVRDLLLVKGYRTLEAGSAELGVELARHHRPQLILMDIQLPGVDGVTALSQLRADPATGTIPVIALTAFAMQDERQRFRSAGFDGYLAKPVNIRELLAVVGAFCERRTPHPDPLPEDEGAEHKPLPDRARENWGGVPEVEGAP
jgi:two-component system, cell cycle response regulator DivK